MRGTILIAEDEAVLRDLLSLALRVNKFDVVAAGTTREAILTLQSRHVDLLLLDLRLGKESGLDLLKDVRQLPRGRDLPVILLTGCAERNAVLTVAQLGVQGYVLKSQFSREDLVARITQQLVARKAAPPRDSLPVSKSEPSRPGTPMELLAPEVKHSHVPSDEAPSAHHEEAKTEEGAVLADRAAGLALPDVLRTLKPIVTREQALEQIDKCAELKAMSPTVSQLMSITDQPDCSLEQIARIIKRDQAISLKVLRIANSVVYNRGGPVDTLQKAMVRIGIAQVRQLVLNISVIDNFQLAGLGESFNSGLFWEHSIATGLIAAAITRARRGDERAIDSAFTSGLLHDVARMVFAEQLGDMYKRVLDTASRLQLPLDQVETRMLMFNHAELMERVLHAWQFPPSLIEPIAMHHSSAGNIRNLSPQIIAEASTLALANRLAHAMLLGSSGNDCLSPTDEFIKVLELDAETIRFIEDEIPDQTADMKYAMLQSANAPAPSDYRELILKRFGRPIHPLFVSADPAVDGYRLLFDRLGDPDRKAERDIAILHLANAHERESLFDQLRESESRVGVEPLPLVVVSSSPTLKLEPRLVAGRMHKVLPSSFTLARLIDTINSLLPALVP